MGRKKIDLDEQLFTTFCEMTRSEMREYLLDMKNREIRLQERQKHLDEEVETVESAMRRASLHKNIIGDPTEDNLYFGKQDRVFYFWEESMRIIHDQMNDVMEQDMKIRNEQYKISYIKRLIRSMSQDDRVILTSRSIREEEWGKDSDMINSWLKELKYQNSKETSRRFGKALTRLCEKYNLEIRKQ